MLPVVLLIIEAFPVLAVAAGEPTDLKEGSDWLARMHHARSSVLGRLLGCKSSMKGSSEGFARYVDGSPLRSK